MASQENEPLFEYIKDAITALRLRHQRSDSNRILKHLQEYAATILQEMPMGNLTYNRPTESGPSYYVTDENSD